jgi:MYXO-CTERM domain-containing protein
MRKATIVSLIAIALTSTSALASIRLTPGITAITVYESTGNPSADPYVFSVPTTGGAAAGYLGGIAGSSENYSVFVTDALGNPDGDGSYIRMNCRYPIPPGTGTFGHAFNIAGVTLTIGGVEYFADTIIAFQYGFDGFAGSEVNAIDGNLFTHTYFGTTGLDPNVPDMSLTLGWSTIPTPGAAALLGLGGLVASRRRRATNA